MYEDAVARQARLEAEVRLLERKLAEGSEDPTDAAPEFESERAARLYRDFWQIAVPGGMGGLYLPWEAVRDAADERHENRDEFRDLLHGLLSAYHEIQKELNPRP